MLAIVSFVSPLLLIPLALGYAIYAFLTSTFDYWLIRGVPHRKPSPLLGNFGDLLLFRKSLPEGIWDMYSWFANERYFGVFRVRSPMLVVRDPELLKHILVKDFQVFCNRGIPVNSTKDPLSGHLFNLEGKHWKSLRSKLTPAFSSGKLKMLFYLLAECSDVLSGRIEAEVGSSQSEVRDLVANYTIDVIGSCAFGIQINDDSDFRRVARNLSKPSYKATLWRMLRTSLPRIYKFLGVQVIDESVTNFFINVVSQIVKERESNKATKRHDFMDLLIELKNRGTLELDGGNEVSGSEEIVLDENAIAAQAFVFFVAGFETSSNTVAFCLHEFAVNPEIQEKARNDVVEALEKRDGKLTYDTVQDMKYLDMVILETLRKYPPAPMLSRRCESQYRLPGTDLELTPGMRVVVPIYGLHHDPVHYPEPDLFRPERFLDEERRLRHPFTFLPFGEGPRNCIGMRFAMLQSKVGIVTFLRKYRVEVCEKTEVPIKFSRRSLVTASESGVWLKISKVLE